MKKVVGSNRKSYSDRELINMFLNGDDTAFDRFYDRVKSGLFSFISRRCKDAEDLFQECFTKLLDAVFVREIYYPKAYLYKVAISLLAKKGRVVVKEVPLQNIPESDWAASDVNPDIEPDQDTIDHALNQLAINKPMFYEVVHLHLFEDMTFADLAEVIGVSQGTAASRYRYGLHYLKKYMEN